MCESAVHRPFNSIVDPFPFSTFQFLRTCNRLILPTDVRHYYTVMKDSRPLECLPSGTTNPAKPLPLPAQKSNETPSSSCPETPILYPTSSSTAHPKDHTPPPIPLMTRTTSCSPVSLDYTSDYPCLSGHNRLSGLNYTNLINRRQRGEKRPIPDEQKDEKYYERRKRNNEAAKKSRDARKLREDRIAFRAAILEQENAILRAQVVALRDEMTTLRQIMGPRATQISVNL